MAPEYEILDQFHSRQRHIKIIHVGAGAAGLLTAYKARSFLKNYELVCYEKNPTVGGTWWENRYPGVACDVPSHGFTFSFDPNPDWSSFYATGQEIQKYFEEFYRKYDLSPYMRFNTLVVAAKWHQEKGEWEVELENDGKRSTDWCNVLINGSGIINKWKWPNIEGIKDYKGLLSHSATWDTSTDWKGKRVAVIGSGSSSLQMVPKLAEGMALLFLPSRTGRPFANGNFSRRLGSTSLTVFARSPTWISAQIGPLDIKVLPEDEASVSKPNAVGKHFYTEAEKQTLRTNPERLLKYRKQIETSLHRMFPIFLRGSETSKMLRTATTESTIARIGPGHDELKEMYIPKFSPGCRRLTPGEGFFEAIVKDHVSVISVEIQKFTELGLMTADGTAYDFDIIVCCTGYDVSFAPHYKVTGLNGRVMQEDWAEYPNIYLSVASPNFPNYFTIGGSTGTWGQGSILVSHEVQAEYALQACLKISSENLHSVYPLQAPTTAYLEHHQKWHTSKSIWVENCRSWYKWPPGKPDGRVQLYCGSMLHLLKTLRVPRWEDYVIERKEEEGNMWAFLGNGMIELEILGLKNGGEGVDYAPHVRNADVPWSLDS